tara:strand:+ start:119 stop:667 length:549 start_codon:yes stop_codon:yes gene_type:complete
MADYSKSLIYKICCKDSTIQDIYIGSTINFRNRKYDHKECCNNEKKKQHTQHKYKFIRDNGGWDNWEMIQIKDFSCKNKRELEAEERKVFEELKPTLNTIRPYITKEEKYLQKHNEKYKLKVIEWTKKNPEKVKEASKKSNEKRKVKALEDKKICVCGSHFQYYNIRRHERTIKHKNYLTTL